MTYIEGFVLAVPTAKKDEYVKHATDAYPIFADLGVSRMVETWGDDIPEGKATDFRKAVQAREDETIVFSWFEYPDRATRDAANARMMADPRMADIGATMPFDGSRMIMAGFDSIVDEGSARGGYIDGFIAPVPHENKNAYREMAAKAAGVLREHGAVRVVECWGDDLTDGEVTDYTRAVQANGDETVVFSWIEWPDKATRTAGWEQTMADDRMKPDGDRPFDGTRMFWGGFVPLLDR